jgi:hypothetical protein
MKEPLQNPSTQYIYATTPIFLSAPSASPRENKLLAQKKLGSTALQQAN